MPNRMKKRAMRQLRDHVQWMGASALGLALLSGLTGCADRARWGDANVRPDRPECLVGEQPSAIPPRADGLVANQRQQRCNPGQAPQGNIARSGEQPMQLDFRQHK
ncbi:hypothetical protein XALC_0957 [Xanthomonas albilineans GPE PC73]|uniref:Uncharacterized protein n=3 Tax=Xanthomonas albilineans TaxID=29447 RepID=D2UCP1_XANAP|nr:hypothetical protein XALC_0957 [Xanthomonas albilineans GPE PC73]